MSQLKLAYPGYVCAPYLHNHESIELKESWIKSKNVIKMYFVTGTFSNESKPYFTDFANHYVVAKFKDSKAIMTDLSRYNQDKSSFVFNIKNDLFARDVDGETNFISVYYLDYGEQSDLQEVANLLLKREKVAIAGFGNLDTVCSVPSKFTFPYSENIVVLEVTSEKNHQSVKKYCERTRRDVSRKGLTMTNLLALSILEKLK